MTSCGSDTKLHNVESLTIVLEAPVAFRIPVASVTGERMHKSQEAARDAQCWKQITHGWKHEDAQCRKLSRIVLQVSLVVQYPRSECDRSTYVARVDRFMMTKVPSRGDFSSRRSVHMGVTGAYDILKLSISTSS